jgi:predicted MFS family arabinose efflux permease
MFRPVLLSLISECAPDEKRATIMGRFDMSFYGALSLGPVLGGMLKDVFGFAGIFVTLSVLCVIALVTALICIPYRSGKAIRDEEQISPSSFSAVTGMTRRHTTFRGLLAFIFGRACGIALLGAFLPILLTVKLGLSGTHAGIVMASSSIVMTLLLCPVGQLSDKVPRISLVLLGGTIVPLLYFLIPATADFYQALLLCGSIGFFSVLSQPASSALLLEEGNRHGMGATVGIFNAVLNMGFVAGPLVGSVIQSSAGLNAVFYLAGFLGLVSVLLFFFSLQPLLFYDRAPFLVKHNNELTGVFNAAYGKQVMTDKNRYGRI